MPAYFQLAKRRFDAENFVRLKWPTFLVAPSPPPQPQPHHTTLSLAVSILRDENEGSRCNIEAEVQDVPKTDERERETEWAQSVPPFIFRELVKLGKCIAKTLSFPIRLSRSLSAALVKRQKIKTSNTTPQKDMGKPIATLAFHFLSLSKRR